MLPTNQKKNNRSPQGNLRRSIDHPPISADREPDTAADVSTQNPRGHSPISNAVLRIAMDQEIHLDSIQALERQIQEHERTIIQLKRTRNSLLNVSIRLPPEILGRIFCWNVIPGGDFDGLPEPPHNFLLVCHHWFQVASRTPELWNFWGNSIQDWGHQHARRRIAPLDLVLSARAGDRRLDDALRDALQDYATRDTMQRVHLEAVSAELLNSIISSITTEGGETRSISVQSFILRNGSTAGSNVEISNFFSRYRFPKLQRLRLSGCSISSWDLLRSRTTSLTSLSLTDIRQSPLPTLSQMLSILSANPNLQYLMLSDGSVPDVDSDWPSFRVHLSCLKRLDLKSGLHRVFGLLNRLELPDKLDDLNLSLTRCPPSDLPQTIGPYLRNYIRRRSPDRLKLLADSNSTGFSILMGDACEGDFTREESFIAIGGTMSMEPGEEAADILCFDIVGHFSPEVVEVTTNLPILRSGEATKQMTDLTLLFLDLGEMSKWFTEPDIPVPHDFQEALLMLHSILKHGPYPGGEDWDPLTDFLTRRAAVGNRIYSLSLRGHPHMGEDVVECIKRVVKAFDDR